MKRNEVRFEKLEWHVINKGVGNNDDINILYNHEEMKHHTWIINHL